MWKAWAWCRMAPAMRERPVAMVIHGGPGGDHSGFKPGFSPLA